jgi:hypothetical protein
VSAVDIVGAGELAARVASGAKKHHRHHHHRHHGVGADAPPRFVEAIASAWSWYVLSSTPPSGSGPYELGPFCTGGGDAEAITVVFRYARANSPTKTLYPLVNLYRYNSIDDSWTEVAVRS